MADDRTDGRVPPHNLEAEESLLGAMLLSRDSIKVALPIVASGDFYKPAHGHVFDTIASLYGAGEPSDPVTVGEELRRRGVLDSIGGPSVLVSLQAATPATSNSGRYATIISDLALLRRLISTCAEIAELAYGVPPDPTTLVEQAIAMFAEVRGTHIADADVLVRSFDEFVHQRDETVEELVPGLINKGDRFLVVAPEGYGKTMLWRQFAVMCGQGLHPLTHFKTGRRIRTLLVDLENPERIIRSKTRPIVQRAAQAADYQADMAWLWHEPAGIDIRTRVGFARLESAIAQVRPELVCLGPLYKLFGKRSNEEHDDVALEVTARLDDLRTRYEFALLIEHHAPHGAGLREMRPFGSSVWLRWPEFGISLTPRDKEDRSVMDWGHFRGPRDERQWPDSIHWSSVWPWVGYWSAGEPTPPLTEAPPPPPPPPPLGFDEDF